MRTRTLLSALATFGVTVGTAWAQQTQPGPPATPPPTPPATTPDNVPRDAKRGTTPATQPDNVPRDAPPGTTPATRPDNTAPGTAVPPPRVVPGKTPPVGTSPAPVIGSGGTGVRTPVAVPPDLAKLEAEAAVEVPAPRVPAGKAPEAKAVAEAAVKVRRATWVVEKLLPPPPDGIAGLSFEGLKVGTRGWLDTAADVERTIEGISVVRPTGVAVEGVTVGVAAPSDAATTKTIALRGEFVVERAVTLDGREVFVLKEVAPAKALDPAAAKLISAARARLEEAKADYANAVAVLAAAKKKAVEAVMARADAEAAKQIVVPDNATGEERIKAKKDQQELAAKLAKAELDRIAEAYGSMPAVDPTRR